MPAMFFRQRVVPAKPCSFEKRAALAASLNSGDPSSLPKSDHVPELKKSGLA